MPLRQAALEAMARLVESADFERVLRSPSRAKTPHFAVHHLAAGSSVVKPPPQAASEAKLSTVEVPGGARAVDDSTRADSGRRLGAVVPKRHARRAVTRSLLKRQVYAAGSRHAGALSLGLWIVRLRAPFDRTVFPSASSTALRDAARGELDALFRALTCPGTP
jgi:ribonuclease P protein component